MSYLLRLILPDRPGSLGAVATAIGEAGGDIVSVDIVERVAADAVDDIVVDLPAGKLPDSIISAAESLPGVRVESVRPFDGALSTHRELTLLEAMAAAPAQAMQLMVDEIPRIFRSGWALTIAPDGTVAAHSHSAPYDGEAIADWKPLSEPRLIDPTLESVPEDWARLDTSLMGTPSGAHFSVIAGRPGGPDFRPSEVARLNHLVGLANTISRPVR